MLNHKLVGQSDLVTATNPRLVPLEPEGQTVFLFGDLHRSPEQQVRFRTVSAGGFCRPTESSPYFAFASIATACGIDALAVPYPIYVIYFRDSPPCAAGAPMSMKMV
jgi:hypothetical protein